MYGWVKMAQVQQLIAIGGAGAESGTKLYVSNLEYGVSNEDIKVLFSEVGLLKRHSIHYDRMEDQRFNNVLLDGKPMKIELVGVNIVTHATMVPSSNYQWHIRTLPERWFWKKPLWEGDGIDVAAAAKDLGRDVEEATTTARSSRPSLFCAVIGVVLAIRWFYDEASLEEQM
ncbi:hypothetical protein C3L33_00954, partial [Rhododendron williamsianum]